MRHPAFARLRLLRRWSAGHQEVTEVLRRRETGAVVRATLHDLALFSQVLTSSAQRVLDRAHRAIENGTHFLPFVAYELCNNCRHSGAFASRYSSVRPIPSASAMSVTLAPEASALAIRVRRPSRRSSAVGLKCASSAIGVLRLLTRANRRDTFVYAFNFRVAHSGMICIG